MGRRLASDVVGRGRGRGRMIGGAVCSAEFLLPDGAMSVPLYE